MKRSRELAVLSREHHMALELALRLRRATVADADLGEALRDHVRHEERTLFGRIEATLEPDELVAVGAALDDGEDGHR